MNDEFPYELGILVRNGWSKEPEERPHVKDFEAVLESMSLSPLERMASLDVDDAKVTSLSCYEQVKQINLDTFIVPLISMKWTDEVDSELSKKLRGEMMQNLLEKSKMKTMINESVVKAMEVVPRHLFMEPSRISGDTEEEKLPYVYAYNKAMGATEFSNESCYET